MKLRLVPISLAVVALGAAACSSNTSSTSTTTAPAPTTSSTAKASTTTTAGTATTTTPVTTACTAAHLAVTAGQGGGAAGHIDIPVVFKNIGPSTCTLYGFPGVAALDSSDNQVAQATRTPSPAPTLVTIPAGGTASALVVTTDVPSGTETTCPTWPAFLVTPPNTKISTKVTVDAAGCPGFSVGAVVSGSQGL